MGYCEFATDGIGSAMTDAVREGSMRIDRIVFALHHLQLPLVSFSDHGRRLAPAYLGLSPPPAREREPRGGLIDCHVWRGARAPALRAPAPTSATPYVSSFIGIGRFVRF